MYLGKICEFASDCPVYQKKTKELGKPVFLVRNVFCNRGLKGWKNCKRYLALETGAAITEKTTPYKI